LYKSGSAAYKDGDYPKAKADLSSFYEANKDKLAQPQSQAEKEFKETLEAALRDIVSKLSARSPPVPSVTISKNPYVTRADGT
jgi:hypothetical protein